jgi:CRISPR-associated endoribonuclease Cas6
MQSSMHSRTDVLNTERGELFAIMLRLHPVEAGWLSPTSGSQAHAAFLDIVRQSDPELAERLHQADQRRPFTVSLLQGFNHLTREQYEDAMAYGKKVLVSPGQVYWLRFTMLDTVVFGTLVQHFLARPNFSAIRIGDTYFEIGRLIGPPYPNGTSNPWVAHSSFAELSLSTEPLSRYQFEFASPTAFSLGQQKWGKQMHLFPDPARLFEGLARQWEAFAPEPLRLSTKGLSTQDFAAWCIENLVVNRYNLETRTLHFRKFNQIGFQGKITYDLKGDAHAPEARWLTPLARFALFSGVGYKTTMGMGQTRCLNFTNDQPNGSE